MTTRYELHPLCSIFPRMQGAEFAALVADIKANGQREPIILHDGMILDGGNRYAACLAAGVKPEFSKCGFDDIVGYVLSANLHRRHLTAGQQAVIVAAAQDWKKAAKHGGARITEQAVTLPLETLELKESSVSLETVSDRAAVSGASDKTQRMADKVAKVKPELVPQITSGQKTLPQAVKEIEGEKTKAKKQKKTIAPPPPDDYSELDRVKDELIEAQSAIETLQQTNTELSDRLAIEAMPVSEEEKTSAANTISELRTEVKNLRIELAAVKKSRDTYQRECGELKKQCQIWRRKAEKLAA